MQTLIEYPYGLDVPLADGYPLALFDSAGVRVTNPTLQSAVRATRTLTFTAQPANNDTVTIARRDGSTEVYTFKTALTPTAGEVLIGAALADSITNLASAITGGGTAGTDYATGTEPVTDWDITAGATTLVTDAINYGDAYNTAIAAHAEVSATASWGAATNGVDTPDFKEAKDYGTQANASSAPVARNGIFPFCPTADQLECKRLHVEFDDDSAGGVFERIDPVVLTTLHPAAGDPKFVLYTGRLLTPTDLPASGAYIDIPANNSHADYLAGDPWGGDFDVPETDDIIRYMAMEVFAPYTGDYAFALVKSYDFDGGASANEGRATFVVGADLSRFASTLRGASRLYYRLYSRFSDIAVELGAQAKLDVNAEADTAFNDIGVIRGTAQTGTLSTTSATTDLTGYVDDELIGRTITFVTGTAAGQQGRITDYASLNGQVTYTTLTTAPANADTFVIT